MKLKIILIAVLSLILINSSNAVFEINDETQIIFLKNLKTNEQKYIKTQIPDGFTDFNFIFFKINNQFSLQSNFDNWKIIRYEKEVIDYETKNIKYSYSESGSISKNDFGLVDYKSELKDMQKLTDISNLKEFGFNDLSYNQKLNFILEFLKIFFGGFFWIMLPIHFLIYFCFGRLLFYFYEKYNLNIFKNIIINILGFYLLIYIIQIIFGVSFIQLSRIPILQVFYTGIYTLFQGLLLLYSSSVLKEFTKKYPSKYLKYGYIIYLNLLIFLIILILNKYFDISLL